jgi:hypothetical protein
MIAAAVPASKSSVFGRRRVAKSAGPKNMDLTETLQKNVRRRIAPRKGSEISNYVACRA